MNTKIDRRELFVLSAADGSMRGTFHKPSPPLAQTRGDDRPPAAIVILNSLAATRAANGDGAVFLADCIAEMGYPAFRLDLPGFGDSTADPPAAILDSINAGTYAPFAAQAVEELAARYRLGEIVLLGHCAGAVTAVFTAAELSRCAGIIIMGPYFHLPPPPRPAARDRLSAWAMRSPVGQFLRSAIYDPLKAARLRLRANSVPANANRPMLRHWQSLTTAGMPVLSVVGPARKASGKQTRTGEFDYMAHAVKLAGPRGSVEVQFAQGADHSFANRQGRVEVREHIASWLQTHFPLATETSTISAHLSEESSSVLVGDLHHV